MKILLLSHVSDYVGGAERSILDVVDTWKKKHKNVEVEFILRTPLGSYVNELRRRGYKYHSLDYTYWSDSNPPRTKERLYSTSLRNSRAVLKIQDIIKSSKPDVVITNSIVAPWAALAAYFEGVPHVWFAREFGDLDHSREFEIGRQDTWEDIGLLSDLVIANSKTLEKHIAQYVPKSKLLTVYTPFSLDKLKADADEAIDSPFILKKSLKLVLTSGAITRNKGHFEAVKAIGELSKKGYEVELCLVGKPGAPDVMSELKAMIDGYGIKDRIHFVGYQKNPLAYAKQSDIGIMASRMEAFGRVTFEYLAIGLPVVGANTGATPELVDDGSNGYLYDREDASSLEQAIERYAKNKELIAEHSKDAIKKAKAMMVGKNTPEKAYSRIESVLGDATAQRQTLNYANHWLKYPEIAKDYFESLDQTSLRTLIKIRAKRKLKPYYVRLRGIYAKNIEK